MTQAFLDAYDRQAGDAPAWIQRFRQTGIESFREHGLPTRKLEDWKYTDVSGVAATAPRGVAGVLDVAALERAIAPHRLGAEATAAELVFVEGRLAPELSQLGSLPPNVRVGSLASALLECPDLVEPHLGRIVAADADGLSALNAAFVEDGAFVSLPRGSEVEAPIHLIFVAPPGSDRIAANLRNLIVAAASSRATIIETWIGADDSAYFTNAVTEIAGGEGSQVRHCAVESESSAATHVRTLAARLDRDASVNSHAFAYGAALSRADLRVDFESTGAECSLDGLYLVGGNRHVDFHTAIDHRRPQGTSREFYKGVLDGAGTGVFNGKVFVREDAQKCDSTQRNANLLLSDDATIDTKPELEIYADDVKCAHGATIGRLDAQALFYLRSRGISAERARNMLIRAFAGEMFDRLPIPALAERLSAQAWERFGASFGEAA